MLSYRHAFHAGNHADVLKHFVELELLQYLAQKEKPFWYIDTHAGAGGYELDSGYAAQNAEFENGIARLWDAPDLPAELEKFVALIRQFNLDGDLRFYPGSPWVALQSVRAQDRLRLFELHPTDFELLQENFASDHGKVLVQKADGFIALKSLLPPPPRRALVLIDPPYEEKQDYRRVPEALQEGLKRFATGTFAIWYPQLQRPEVKQMIASLKQLPVKSWLHVSLSVCQPAADGFGMFGSGMFVINPPWTLLGVLEKVMPVLVESLAQDEFASFVLEHQAA
jgi:23S rRNA (adenine2030-N6)-methyltransferase